MPPESLFPPWIQPPEAVFFDTEPLVAFIVGSHNKGLLGNDITAKFRPADFEWLIALAKSFRVVTSPHVLAEVNSWLGQTGSLREEIRSVFAQKIPALVEYYSESAKLAQEQMLPVYGLTDMSIINTVKLSNALVLTTDARLTAWLTKVGIPWLLISHIQNWRDNLE